MMKDKSLWTIRDPFDKKCQLCLANTVRYYPELHMVCLMGEERQEECLSHKHKYFECINGVKEVPDG